MDRGPVRDPITDSAPLNDPSIQVIGAETDATKDLGRTVSRILSLPRRRFLARLAAAAALAAFLPVDKLTAQTSSNKPIDWHHHFGPPQWCSFLAARNLLAYPWAKWTPAKDLEDLDQAGVSMALISITYPGIWLSGSNVPIDATRRLARECNEYGATMVANHKGRYGLFAVLPIPDVEGSLREIAYAFDTLKADGVGVLTSYGDKWLGDPAFAPILEELNHRRAIVFTHSNVPNCCTRGGSGAHRYLVPGLDNNVIEYQTDTTRGIMSLIINKAGERYPNIRFTFSHAGGTMPYLIERILGHEETLAKRLASPAEPNTRLYQLRQFYYDTANANNPVEMGALKQVVGASQILFGTDFPYEGPIAVHLKDLKECGVFDFEELQAVLHGNATRLLARARA